MNRDCTSAELDRLKVIQACEATIAQVHDRRAKKRAAALRWLMRPRRFWFTMSAEAAEERVDYDPHLYVGERQLDVAEDILALAEVCSQPTIRLTPDDFDRIKIGWPQESAV